MNKTTPLYRLCFALPLLAATFAHTVPPYAVADGTEQGTVAFVPTWFGYDKGDMTCAGDSVLLHFGEPMVADAQVGTQADVNDYIVTKGLAEPELKATWTAPGELRISLAKDFGKRGQVARLCIKKGLVSTSGKAVEDDERTIGDKDSVGVTYSRWSVGLTNDYTIIAAWRSDAGDIAAVDEAVHKAYFRSHINGTAEAEDTEVPAQVRPATVADALADWEGFRCLCGHDAQEKDRKMLESRPADEVLPHTWRVEAPVLPTADHEMHLVLPGLGEYDEEAGTYSDKKLGVARVLPIDGELTNKHLDVGDYELTLWADQPMSADVEKSFRESAWELAEGKEFSPMAWDEARQAFVAAVADGEVVLTLDKEASLRHAKEYRLVGGGKAHGTTKLVLHAKTPGAPVRVRIVSPIVSLHGKCTGGRDVATGEGLHRKYCTRLAPRTPYLYTDMYASGLRGEGKRRLHCRVGHVDKLQARVYRIEAAGADTPKLLLDYAANYMYGYKPDAYGKGFLEVPQADKKDWKNSIGLPRHLLPSNARMACTELKPDAEGECTLDPSTLFPDKDPHATYFVQLEGIPAADWKEHQALYNQGVIQVTDLGLMWKLSAGRVFAYAYRLSDGKPLTSATLRLLDKEGKQLAELPVSEGVASAAYPGGTRFLQLQQGEDCYTTRAADPVDRSYYTGGWEDGYYSDYGVDAASLPILQSFVFSDRKLYRSGETAHLKGFLRFLKGNELSVPEVESISATVEFHNSRKEFPVFMDGNGGFSLDIPIESGWYDWGEVLINIVYKGDADKTSVDHLAAKAAGADTTDHLYKNYIEGNREARAYLNVQDFRRNEFEVTSRLTADAGTRKARVVAEARNFTGAPLSKGKVECSLSLERINFHPARFSDYRFGSAEEDEYEYFRVSNGGRPSTQECQYTSTEGVLDAEGKLELEMEMPGFSIPGRCRVKSTVSVTNGNEQTLNSVRSCILEGSAVYAGLRSPGRLAKAGGPLELETILVTPEGEAYAGAPLPATLKVTRTSFAPYRYGSSVLSAIRNEKMKEIHPVQNITIGGTPSKLEIPATHPGIYDICVEGLDAQGKPYHTTVRRYVWGGDVSPWEYRNGTHLVLTEDKSEYKPGETARILVQTPVDAEILVTVERGGVLRSFRRGITVDDPVLELPIEAGDAPVVRVSVFTVQGVGKRSGKGLPIIKKGSVLLLVDDVSKHLAVDLETPDKPVDPAGECRVSGVVTDAGGKPVADAEVTLYVEDEGTLQAMGYSIPDPYRHFYNRRPIGVYTFDTHGQFLGDMAGHGDYGNKGVFIGGGGDADVPDGDPSADRGPRRDFDPCALWIAHVRTDEQGGFSAVYRNPDTVTRYRVMAVASAGADKFGTGEAAYRVAKTIMLEPSAPLHATTGDRLDVPVTLTMLGELMPEGGGKEAPWVVRMQGVGADIRPATQSVTLQADRPATLTFPVTVGDTGRTTLTWSVSSPQKGLEHATDAVELGFDVVPATPHLRLPLLGELTKGEAVRPATLLSEKLQADTDVAVTASLSPLTGVCAGVDYLFRYPYGCTEQLCSTMLPWLLQDTLVKWTDAEYPADHTAKEVIAETVRTLHETRFKNGGAYGYWSKEDANTDFTPYVAYVLSYCKDCENSWRQRSKNQATLSYIKKELENHPDGNLLGLMVLAKEDPDRAKKLLRSVREKRRTWRLADRWMEVCAELELLRGREGIAPDELERVSGMFDSVKADTRNAKPEERTSDSYAEPPFEALLQIANIRMAALKHNIPDRLDYVRDYAERIVRGQSSPLSTREMGWCCLMLDEFCREYEKHIADKHVSVNGRDVSLGKPLRLRGKLGDLPELLLQSSGKAYISGLATGYTEEAQGTGAVDKGFLVSRRYEKLMPDGSWKPVGEFTVGDVVRVSFSARGTKPNSGRYLMAEDRLPAGFEAVNPELASQALPEGVDPGDGRCWHVPGWVDHVEYHKDRVLFSATSFAREAALEASYVVRVVKSGKMTAPAAKVEMMYSPGTYGLSIPQEFEVSPRKD